MTCGVANCVRSAGKWAARKNKSSELRGPFILERASQTFLPSHYSGDDPRYCLGNGAAEKIAVHSKENMLYVVGYKVIAFTWSFFRGSFRKKK